MTKPTSSSRQADEAAVREGIRARVRHPELWSIGASPEQLQFPDTRLGSRPVGTKDDTVLPMWKGRS